MIIIFGPMFLLIVALFMALYWFINFLGLMNFEFINRYVIFIGYIATLLFSLVALSFGTLITKILIGTAIYWFLMLIVYLSGKEG